MDHIPAGQCSSRGFQRPTFQPEFAAIAPNDSDQCSANKKMKAAGEQERDYS
jgi:hypothetical protein